MVEDLRPPFRQQFDNARDPYSARNALGITSMGGGGGGFITAVTPPLQVTGTTLSIDLSAYLTTATAAATYQPLDADLTALAALTGTNTIYYRSAANTWAAVTIGTGLTFTGGTLSASGGGSSTTTPPQGRLTLQTATPVMTTTQAAKTTIFYTPYQGNQVPIYDGTSMAMTTFAELSNVTTASSTGKAGPAAVAASSVYDLFVWNDAGTVRLTRGPAWTNATTRSAGTALTQVLGLLLNNASITNGPAASRGTYVGSVRSNGSSQLDWILGGLAAGGTAAFLGVWNCYNRISVAGTISDSTDSWTGPASTVIRSANSSATMSVSFVMGLQEDACFADYSVSASTPGNFFNAGIGVDSTTAFSGRIGYCSVFSSSAVPVFGSYSAQVLGFHVFYALESSTGASTTTWYGDAGVPGYIQNGLGYRLRM